MKLRRRLILVVTGLTLVTLGGAFAVVFSLVNRSQERQLDQALAAEARQEADEAKATGGDRLMISDRPGPAANDVGPLTKYGVIYGLDGAVIHTTVTFKDHAPTLSALPRGRPFDLWARDEHLRGIVVPIAVEPLHLLLLAAPRTDLDGDERFLGRAMGLVFLVAVVWAVLIATWVVRRLTRDHEQIATVARRVAGGDLSARIEPRAGDDEVAQLARDVNQMIVQLASLLASQQQFIAHAAHELRSPLTTLYGELSHALRRSRDAEGYRQSIEEALDGAKRLKALAEDLLALARLSAGPHEPSELVELKIALLEAVRQVGASPARVRVHGDDTEVFGRATDLGRLFRNLIENGLRHAPEGSTVDVRTELTDQRVRVSVFNEGDPIAAEERERIFEPFVRGAGGGADGRPGAGLGLAIARQIARSHGGDICVSERSLGAEFYVELPLQPRRVA